MESSELQVYLAGKLDALGRSSSVSHHPTAGERSPGERRRRTYEYTVSGARVCVAVFLFAHNCSRYLLHKIEAHLAAGCVGFTEHGGTGKAPWNVIPEEEMQAVVSFIEGYANRYGLPQPAAPRGHNKPAPTYLPCYTTKVLLHGEYVEAGGKLSYVSFTRVWKSKCTSVVIMKPREDVCGTCSDLQSRISHARTEENRIDTTKLLHTHMTKAIDSRDFYRSCIARAKLAHHHEVADHVPDYTHLTFYFAQQATIPHHGRQVGALYFRVPFRIQIFGIANEAQPIQRKYLVDEHQTIGSDGSKAHGPNSVLSMLHYHLQTHTRPSPSLGLHADNCCGQNKSKTVMAYLAWRILVGLNAEIQLDFMRVGHTRCFVDAGFGLLKQKYRRSNVNTFEQLVGVVRSSATMNEAEKFSWEWREWDKYFELRFRPVKNITSYILLISLFIDKSRLCVTVPLRQVSGQDLQDLVGCQCCWPWPEFCHLTCHSYSCRHDERPATVPLPAHPSVLPWGKQGYYLPAACCWWHQWSCWSHGVTLETAFLLNFYVTAWKLNYQNSSDFWHFSSRDLLVFSACPCTHTFEFYSQTWFAASYQCIEQVSAKNSFLKFFHWRSIFAEKWSYSILTLSGC